MGEGEGQGHEDVHVHVHAHMYTRMYTQMHIQMYLQMYIQMYIQIHIQMYIQMYMHICIYTCIYICVYIYMARPTLRGDSQSMAQGHAHPMQAGISKLIPLDLTQNCTKKKVALASSTREQQDYPPRGGSRMGSPVRSRETAYTESQSSTEEKL